MTDAFADINPRPLVAATKPFYAGSARQLLFDDFHLHLADRNHWDQIAWNVRFSNGPVEKSDGPIMVSDAPFEQSMAWISVMREAGGYRMWYNSSQSDRRGMRVSYAESDDGLTWRRPVLNLLEVDGCRDHNIVFEGGRDGSSPEMGSVFRDPAAEPGEEYKMVYAEWIDRRLFAAGQPSNGAMRGACSSDGIHWQRYRENFTTYYPDSQNAATWDPTLGRYVCYHRRLAGFAGLDAGPLQVEPQRRGRSVVRLDSDDFRTWSNPEPAIVPDLEDGLNTDVYNSAYSRHPDNDNAHYMFPSFYRHFEGTFEVQALTSRDNRSWARPCRDTFIALGVPGEFDCYIISVAPGIVPVDGDTWALYYRSGDGPHAGSRPVELDYEPESRVGRVTFGRDRVVGIEGSAEGGQFSLRPLAFEGSGLVINAEPTGPDPEIHVQLVSSETHDPIAGYTFGSCEPVRQDGLDQRLRWNGSAAIGEEVSRESLRLHFRIRSMRIYAFQFVD